MLTYDVQVLAVEVVDAETVEQTVTMSDGSTRVVHQVTGRIVVFPDRLPAAVDSALSGTGYQRVDGDLVVLDEGDDGDMALLSWIHVRVPVEPIGG